MATTLPLSLRLAVFVIAPFCYALLNVLSQLSKEEDGTYAYSMPSVILLAELIKFSLSITFLSRQKRAEAASRLRRRSEDGHGDKGAEDEVAELSLSLSGSVAAALRSVFLRQPWRWCLFSVPSMLYAVNNMLDMLNNMYMDPATESVLVQLKILTTAISWRLIFGSSISIQKWVSLLFLLAGCCLAALPSDGKETSSMYIEPFGVVLVSMYVCISATAGVYNEWLYKSIGSDESIHISNARIYVVGVLFCMCTHLHKEGLRLEAVRLCQGYNAYTWGLVATYSVMGLLLAQVMKHFDNIVKLFISGSSMYASALLTVIIFKRYPSGRFMCSLLLVTAAQVGYNLEMVRSRFMRKEE